MSKPKRDSEDISGVLVVNKPSSMTSARVVDHVKRLLPRGTKVGHAGTLDPFATGVLVLLIGKATKQCEAVMGLPKTYEATIKFGATTATDDVESPEQSVSDIEIPHRAMVESALRQFEGLIQQRPPAYSAIRVGGRRAYELARKGAGIPLQARAVLVHGIELLDYAWPILKIRIDCGRGTYIRAIARDLGLKLGVGGYLTELCRTRVGSLGLDGAVPLEQISPANVRDHLRVP